ncbi:NUDIX domain-containing protein [Nostoc sp. TCL240-02]|uniref:NUDIX hydrolase n=1 Tax=Nostoc sp. TCL240-02 TaxID=2572090 RepID=UPI00157FB846|nr:NUDIX domain-containing protein [Nostoc sp. TCL240-02]QKQ74778.1 NUDIX domain-containing protein [Nostoc sp. TCL240-02]
MSTQPTTKKAIAYVTNKDELMVFRHTDFPEAGVQVPAGTVEESEEPSEAVLREIYEESGVKGVRIIELLGIYQYNMAPYRDEIQERYVYHLELTEPTPSTWQYWEMHSNISKNSIAFDFYWVKLDGSDLGLAGGQGYFLSKLAHKIKKNGNSAHN